MKEDPWTLLTPYTRHMYHAIGFLNPSSGSETSVGHVTDDWLGKERKVAIGTIMKQPEPSLVSSLPRDGGGA